MRDYNLDIDVLEDVGVLIRNSKKLLSLNHMFGRRISVEWNFLSNEILNLSSPNRLIARINDLARSAWDIYICLTEEIPRLTLSFGK